MEPLTKYKRSRTVLRAACTTLFNSLSVKLEAEDPDHSEIQPILTVLEQKINELMTEDKNILELLLENNDVEVSKIEQEQKEADEYQMKFVKLQLAFSKIFGVTNQGTIYKLVDAGSTIEQNSKRKYRLPHLELKKFSGEVKEWLHFWSTFSKIHEDSELAPEDKFQYLIQTTVEGSRARELVTSFPPTGENYGKAIECLKSRFGREDMQVEVYVRELLSLVLKKVINKDETVSICSLYDKLEAQLRALESLGVTTEKYAAMLFPLVESSLPEELLRTWQRMPTINEETANTESKLNRLMSFLRHEVENEERINLATAGFAITSDQKTRKKKSVPPKEDDTPTAASLVNVKGSKYNNKNNCIFCSKNHKSTECSKANKMTLDEKKKIIDQAKGCFYCLKTNYFAKNCRSFVKCQLCDARHSMIVCPKLHKMKQEETSTEVNKNEDKALTNLHSNPVVLLQTLIVDVNHKGRSRKAKIMIDTGSQKSYILEELANKLQLPIIGKELLTHTLFGGVQTKREHNKYKVHISSIDKKFRCNFDVLSQPVIVDGIMCANNEDWYNELLENDIELNDFGNTSQSIDILIGADIAGKLYTGRKYELKNGLVAMETELGWTLMGKTLSSNKESCEAVNVISMFVDDKKISDLWELDTLGIKDPVEAKSKHERDQDVKNEFLKTISINEEKRYEIKLPWLIDRKFELASNFDVAEKRLHSLMKRLEADGNYKAYDQVLKDWQKQGIIEEVSQPNLDKGYFLPHRHVIKENSTTRLRPVFDASSKKRNELSLNDCLEAGPNMIELINPLLLKFRMYKIGVISDIKGAFLQISVAETDREFLKFLWLDNDGRMKILRHTRVVFGVSSSPFLMGAVIDYHLDKTLKEVEEKRVTHFSKEVITKLIDSFYVDNCLTSMRNEVELKTFINQATEVMKNGSFELRGWEYTADNQNSNVTTVLGLKWNKELDTIEFNLQFLEKIVLNCITKRIILSVTHKLFDPIGFLSPIVLLPKLLLREVWTLKLNWDVEVNEEIAKRFTKWFNELHNLSDVKIPRWIQIQDEDVVDYTLHVFCDASQTAYAAAVFLRCNQNGTIKQNLILAKARIAPLKKMSIPRLELMAATVGARLASEVIKNLNIKQHVDVIYWSDSTTVLSWLKSKGKLEVFVKNRVKEILKLTDVKSWRHVPGEDNPADLLSRGCTVSQLIQKKWWEGPEWLKMSPNEWPQSDVVSAEQITVLSVETNTEERDWYYRRFSNYRSNLRLLAWINRFAKNCKVKKEERITSSYLTFDEMNKAEVILIKMIQGECFKDLKDIKSLHVYEDNYGLLRVRTKLLLREDSENFITPIVLPDYHPVVKLLIKERHEILQHAGVQITLNNLREDFWVTKGRKAIRNVIQKCITCKRFTEKHIEVTPGVLPTDRIRDAKVFEIIGIDCAGPLYLKDTLKKVWLCIFTCAVYRAVHLELISQMDTVTFIQALRRFIGRRGRPSTIYTDNGTNFVGTRNLLQALDWPEIIRYSAIHKIQWKFNPPTASWWGGWWERLIRIVKDLLKRVLGRASVTYEELLTITCDCESTINGRPITYVMDNDPNLVPLTPNMFLHEINETGVVDLDKVDEESLNKRLKYLHKLRMDLRKRFRIEYLGFLRQKTISSRSVGDLKVGEVVLIGSDNTKRMDWPLGKIIELIPGQDGECRLVKLKTSKGDLLRPVQRLCRLEISSDSVKDNIVQEKVKVSVKGDKEDKSKDSKTEGDEEDKNKDVKTDNCERKGRFGRKVNVPKRYLD